MQELWSRMQDQTFRDASTVTLPLSACFWLQEPVLLPRISSTSSFGMIVHAMTLSIVTIPWLLWHCQLSPWLLWSMTVTPRYGATALHMAAAAGHLSTVKAVLEAGGHYHHHCHCPQYHHYQYHCCQRCLQRHPLWKQFLRLEVTTIATIILVIALSSFILRLPQLWLVLLIHLIRNHKSIIWGSNHMRTTGLVEEDTMSRQSSCPSPTMIGALHGRDVVLRSVDVIFTS